MYSIRFSINNQTIMKGIFIFFIALFASTQTSWGQGAQWILPHVGYSNTDMLSVDKVEFTKSKTVMYVTASGKSGSTFWIASTASLKASGKRYALQDVPVVGTDKKFVIPDSGKVHFTMQFAPLPASTKLMHFTESDFEGSSGWRLCNIRNGQEKITTKMPKEWQNVEYEDVKALPESRFCDDFTTIRVRILNYVPEAGRTLRVAFPPIDFDKSDVYKSYEIKSNGTAAFKLRPCFPQTIMMQLGRGKFFPLLVIPGKDCDILMDLGKEGTDATVAFKGALAKVNYEVNVQGGKDFAHYDKSGTYIDSLLYSGKDIGITLLDQLYNYRFDIPYTKYCQGTKEWMEINAEYLHAYSLMDYNRHIERKIQKELEDSNSSILKNKPMWNKVRDALRIPRDASSYYKFPHSNKMTYCPQYTEAWVVADIHFQDAKYDDAPYNRDIQSLHWACVYNEDYSYEDGLKYAKEIADPELKELYSLNAQRWQNLVDSINRIPHMHFDTHGEMGREELKARLLEDYRGRNVVLLVYNREEEQVLRELEKLDPIIAKTDTQKTVFIHIDTNFMGARGWLESARRWHGEHYGGKRSRYDGMFNNHGYSASGILYELHAPDGATTLSTTNIKEALEAIENLKKK